MPDTDRGNKFCIDHQQKLWIKTRHYLPFSCLILPTSVIDWTTFNYRVRKKIISLLLRTNAHFKIKYRVSYIAFKFTSRVCRCIKTIPPIDFLYSPTCPLTKVMLLCGDCSYWSVMYIYNSV